MQSECNSGSGESCYLLGEGFALREQDEEALEARFKACQLKGHASGTGFGLSSDRNACDAVYWELGEAKDETVKRMLETVATNFCEMERESCVRAGSRYEESNPWLALDYASYGCNAKVYELCSNVGMAYIRGFDGLNRDANFGLQLLQVACTKGSIVRSTITACYTFGASIDQIRNRGAIPESTIATARDMLERSCDLNHTQSCELLAKF